ncbi:RNA polymerase III subunit RPC82-domain-containing protein [Xylariomycetidae sp. FL2044]|nr:RNA polymerase III subunit RPC82-domain-containing protein [Xylariomycetidae sp. FL2044]
MSAMLVTKNCAELCVLLVNEHYGQLPSRILAGLQARGRSTIGILAQHTSLNQRQVRHGLAVLIQQNLVFYQTDEDSGVTNYEANSSAAYSLVRTGKILESVRTSYGETAWQIVNEVLLAGHTQIHELVDACTKACSQSSKPVNGDSQNGHNHLNANGKRSFNEEEEDPNTSEQAHIYNALADLILAGILEPVSSTQFLSFQDLKSSVEKQVLQEKFKAGVRGSKQTNEFDTAVKLELQSVLAETAVLRMKLERDFMLLPIAKRRKLTNGTKANGSSGSYGEASLLEERNTTLRLNIDKCMVELRNRKLACFVEDAIGETTAQVYAALLSVVSRKTFRCRVDAETKTEEEQADEYTGSRVTTLEVFEQLSPSLDVSDGIGHTDDGALDIRYAEKLRKQPPGNDEVSFRRPEGEEVEAFESDEDDFDDSMAAEMNGVHHGKAVGNGTRGSGIKNEEEGAPVGSHRLQQMRQHLLVLAESKQGFLRHCGSRDKGEWTVDFALLMRKMMFVELDTIIEENFGRQGLRLTRILREKGKIDDKTLPTMALMTKPDVHVKMAEMELGGFLDVQEVPRDNNRTAARTMFFWFFDEERTIKRTLDNTYKSMVRCLQRLEVERRKKKNILEVAERRDIQGHEEDKLRGDVYKEYLEFLEIEKKLIGQVERLDDLVAVIRDF